MLDLLGRVVVDDAADVRVIGSGELRRLLGSPSPARWARWRKLLGISGHRASVAGALGLMALAGGAGESLEEVAIAIADLCKSRPDAVRMLTERLGLISGGDVPRALLEMGVQGAPRNNYRRFRAVGDRLSVSRAYSPERIRRVAARCRAETMR